MDLSRRALLTNEKFFFPISNYWPKIEKYSNEQLGVNIDQSAMFYISMDLSR